MTSRPTSTALLRAAGIDADCDRFEAEWRAGGHPRIEDLLANCIPELRRELFTALLAVEVEILQSRGVRLDSATYQRRFPEHAATVAKVLSESDAAATSVLDDGTTTQALTSGIEADRASMTAVRTLPVSIGSADTSIAAVEIESSGPSPQKLGRFEIVATLGAGAFGTVYRARDPQLERDVAIKVPRAGALRSAEERERFLREARAAAGISHPNICPVHEIGRCDEQDYIVMSFVEGEPLSRVVERGRLDARETAELVRQLALALDEAHRKGIVHRDLKPANVIINARGEPVLMDFGLAQLHKTGETHITHHGAIMGSPAYMSPEQARGATDAIGPASDVYSLGVVLYELLCGRRPFVGTVTEVLGQILYVDPTPPSRHDPDVDLALEAICLKAMARNPANRMASMRLLANELGHWLQSRGRAGPGTNRAPKTAFDSTCAPPGTRRRFRAPSWIAAAVLVTSAGYGAVYFSRQPGGQDRTTTDSAAQSPLSAQLEPQPGEWIPLFNGHDLTGWEGGAAYWSVENGEIVGRLPLEKLPRSTNLCTRRRFADFELRFQAKLPWGNSGIHVRSALIDRDAYVLRGPQIELADNHEAPWGSAITEPSSRNRLLAPIELVEGALRRGDYNDMRIRCQGVRVTVWLNDTMILDGNYKPLGIEGIVGLQLHRAAAGMEVRFRNLAIRELSPATGDR